MSRIRLAPALARLADRAAWKSSELDKSILPAAAATTASPALFSFKSMVPQRPAMMLYQWGEPKPRFRGGQGCAGPGNRPKTQSFRPFDRPHQFVSEPSS